MAALALAATHVHVAGVSYPAAKPLTFPIQDGETMSSPAPTTTATTPSTPAAPASKATTAPAAPTTKKPASLKAVTGFAKLDPNTLANTAHNVATKIGGDPVHFPNP